MDSMILIGAEEVSSAARQLRSAAEQINQATANLEGAIFRQQQFMDDWLMRFEEVLERRRP